MRFPQFNTDWTPTGETLDQGDYFNPSVNRSWEKDFDRSSSSQGYIKIGTMVAIANELAKHTTNEQISRSFKHRFGGEVWSNNFFQPIFDEVYASFPEGYDYLRFFTSVRTVCAGPNGTYKIKAYIIHPTSISYYETIRDSVSADFYVTYDGIAGSYQTPSFTESQKVHLRDKLLEIVVTAHSHFNSRMGSNVYCNDSIVPRMVKLPYQFNTNATMYYPEARGHNLGNAWQTPSNVAHTIANGSSVRLTIREDYDSVNFKELPPPADRRTLSNVLQYSANVLDYLPFTIKGPKEPNATLYGVELETSSAYSAANIIDAQKDLFFILKQDSSIRGCFRYAYEMVTVPASLRAHKRLWAEFFEKIDYTQFDTSKDTGNGMHVHVDRKTFKTDQHLNRFTWFFIDPTNRDFIFTMSERQTKQDMDTWAPTPDVNDTRPYHTRAQTAVRLNGSIRGTVHFKGSKTVEIRMFKGIVSYATVLKNIEFVDSVVEYTRLATTLQMSLSNYFSWLESLPKNKYSTLKLFLAEAKVGPTIDKANLDKFLWGIKNDDLIAAKLNKAPFPVTTKLITMLNKRKGRKRTFFLKDGKVQCLIRNTGLLAKLDKIAQQKQTRGSSSFSVTSI